MGNGLCAVPRSAALFAISRNTTEDIPYWPQFSNSQISLAMCDVIATPLA